MSEITVPSQAGLILDSLTLSAPMQANRSAWTGRRKSIGLPGTEGWKGRISIDLQATEDDEQPWRAFLFALGGPANWFKYQIACDQIAVSNPTVGSGASNGYTLPMAGIGTGTFLRAGQWMTVPLPSGRKRAVCLIADLVGSSGTGTASFRPALGETPAGGATIEATDPYIPFSPTSDELGFDFSQGVASTSFDVEEAQ
jgi:hypothetical protein